MENKPFVAGLLYLIVMGWMFPVIACAGDMKFANAHFSSVDPSGCITTEAFVLTRSGRFNITVNPDASLSRTHIRISQVNDCKEQWLMDASGSAINQGLQVDSQLSSADLATVIKVFDRVARRNFNVDLNLQWTAAGDPMDTHNNFYFRAPGSVVRESKRFLGTYRAAKAVGGVFIGTSNFIPDESEEAEIASLKQPQ